MALPNWSIDQILKQLEEGPIWAGSDITYKFPTSVSQMQAGRSDSLSSFSPLTDQQQTHAIQALQLWAGFIDETATQVSSTASANLEFGNFSNNAGGYAYAYFPPVGSVWLNANYKTGTNSLNPPAEGQYGYEALMHEIGHALGLNHAGNYNGDGAKPLYFQDSDVYTIMSYFGPGHGTAGKGLVQWADWIGADGVSYAPQTPMPLDILAIQQLYGRDITTRTDNTVYGFNSNVTGRFKELYDFTINKDPVLTIFDSGGNDTLNLSGWSTSCNIDLSQGAYSDANSMTMNIAIAYNCNIENAVGGPNNDRIIGNALDNAFFGDGGNDYIDGKEGLDTAVFMGKRSEHGYTRTGNQIIVVDKVAGSDATDTLLNIERLDFSDGDLTFYIAATTDNKTIYRLYKAAFARTPDEDGDVFWVGQHNKGMSLDAIAQGFQASPEFIQKYGANLSNNDYVYKLYFNVLGRAPDQAGLTFWQNELNGGILNRNQIMIGFADSPENVKNTAPDVDNGFWFTTPAKGLDFQSLASVGILDWGVA